jgi:ComF family protein
MLKDLISLIYPQACVICPGDLYHGEQFICSECRFHLPRTGYHHLADNPIAKNFWGRIPVESATAYFYFNKGLKVQQLVHQVKYRGKKELGVFLGNMFGAELKSSSFAEEVNLVIPVPLHEQKQKRRGYNQSYFIARGIAEAIAADCLPEIIKRTEATDTQTKKSRIKRWENVEDKFAITDTGLLQDKHVLLVDDVVTTGSTLEACAQEILKVPGTKISIAALACTQ